MPTLNRRSILKGLAAAPVGAKQASKEIAEMAGVSSIGSNAIAEHGIAPMYHGETAGRMLTAFKAFGLPDWKRREIRDRARTSRVIDPDIASMKSLSLDAKLRKQWQRRERELTDTIFDELYREIDREGFFARYVWEK